MVHQPELRVQYQGHRKQFLSDQANQLQICLDRMIIIVQISMGSMLMLEDLRTWPPEKIL